MNDVRRRCRSGTLLWVLAAALTIGSTAPAIAGQLGSDPVTPMKQPSPTPTPSPDPSPTPSISPEPSPTPTQTPEPTPDPSPEPSPDPSPAGSKSTPGPPSGVDTGVVGPIRSPGSPDLLQAEHGAGFAEHADPGRHQRRADGAVDATGSFIESVTSILDQLASVDAPIVGAQLPCPATPCSAPLGATRSKATALASVCILLAVVGALGLGARRRRSSDDPPAMDA